MRVTSISSASPTGRKLSSRLLRSRRNSSGFSSSSRTCLLARRPWMRRLRLVAALPSAVRGPVLFLAFSRLALILASLGWRGSFGLSIVFAGGKWPDPFAYILQGRVWGGGGYLVQVIENKGAVILLGQ